MIQACNGWRDAGEALAGRSHLSQRGVHPGSAPGLEDLNRQMAGDFEAVLVVDGSPDRCAELLAEAVPRAGFESRFLALSTNFGSFAAIRRGLATPPEISLR